MHIKDLLSLDQIKLNVVVKDKNDCIDQAIELLANNQLLSDKEAFRAKVLERESISTTGVGNMIAIPHGQDDSVIKTSLVAMTIEDGVDYDSLDNQKVKLVFMIAANKTANDHLDALAKLATLLMDKNLVRSLINAPSKEVFLDLLNSAEASKEEKSTNENSYDLLAVTSCPTGIAHTYMAMEALEKAASKKGYKIKVETRGSAGVKNELSAKEIENAKAIIIAADAKVPTARFNGKKIIIRSVSDGISKAESLIDIALSTKNIHQELNTQTNDTGGAQKIYTQLMNGVSHMLPFVVGGGILIALAFLIDGLLVDLKNVDASIRANFGSITSYAATLKNIGGLAFSFMLPVLAGYIAMSIGDRPALALGFVGGAIAANNRSGFLGALAAGFIAGYIIKYLRKLCAKLPETTQKLAPVLIYPLFGILIIGLIMFLIIEPSMGFINEGLNNFLKSLSNTNRIILGFILAAMMAIDMGGPFNKAAYVFGTASISSGFYDIMASVMIGGMIPPIAIALASILFKNKFAKEQRAAALSNFVMGLSFITEGAIPFAASDPIRVIGSSIIGSGIAGALSMYFNCKLMAPHGGIFVIPVMENALMYLLAIIIGSLISAILLGLSKKKISNA